MFVIQWEYEQVFAGPVTTSEQALDNSERERYKTVWCASEQKNGVMS